MQKGSVSVPGIGTFFRAFQPATIAPDTGQVEPPAEVIRFHGEVQLPSLYSSRLSELLFIHPDIAQQMEAELGDYLRQQLKSHGIAKLPALGYLEQKAQTPLCFVSLPAQKAFISDQYFGLKHVFLQPKPKPSGLPEKTPSQMRNANPPHEKLNGHTSIKWQPYLLVGLLVLIGVLIIYNGPFMNQRAHLAQGLVVNVEQSTPFDASYQDAPPEPLATASIPTSSTSTNKPLASSPGRKTQGDNLDVRPQPQEVARSTRNPIQGVSRGVGDAPAAPASSPSGSTNLNDLQEVLVKDQTTSFTSAKPVSKDLPVFHLISASFTRMEAAESYAADYIQKGYQTEILIPQNGPSTILRVSIFQSNEINEVKNFQKRLNLSGNELLWIFEE